MRHIYRAHQCLNVWVAGFTRDLWGALLAFFSILIILTAYCVVKLHHLFNVFLMLLLVVAALMEIFTTEHLMVQASSIHTISSKFRVSFKNGKLSKHGKTFLKSCPGIKMYILDKPIRASNIFMQFLSTIILKNVARLLVSFEEIYT